MPTVTVIIPTYNRGYIVRRAIDSLLTQSFTDFEVIIVDDGSTDDTRLIVESLKDARIRYIYKPNGGVSSARNLGLKEAAGEFIAFLDSDDFWPQNFLATMLDALQKNPDYGLAYCLTYVKTADETLKNHDSPKRCHSGNITENLFTNSVIWPSAAIFRKSISEGIFLDTQFKNAEDSDFFLRMSARAKYLFVDGIRAIRTANMDSLSNSAGTNCARILSLERFYFHLGGDKLVSKNAAFKKLAKACRRIAERHRKNNNKKAALYLYKKALRYQPTDVRLYIGFVKAAIMTKDNLPDWQMPKPLGNPLCHLCNQDEQKLI